MCLSNEAWQESQLKVWRRRRQRKRQKSKTTTLHAYQLFWYISLPSLHDYDVKMPNIAFFGRRIQGTAKFSFSWTWTWFLRIHLQESSSTFDEAISVGIITMKIDGKRIKFQSDVFAAVSVLRSYGPFSTHLPPFCVFHVDNVQDVPRGKGNPHFLTRYQRVLQRVVIKEGS